MLLFLLLFFRHLATGVTYAEIRKYSQNFGDFQTELEVQRKTCQTDIRKCFLRSLFYW